jgi:hypothetical protein
VELPESFLEGLPESKRKVKARHLKLITGSKTDAKVNRFKMLKDHFAKAYIKEQNKAKENSHRRNNTLRVVPQYLQGDQPRQRDESSSMHVDQSSSLLDTPRRRAANDITNQLNNMSMIQPQYQTPYV